MATRTADAHRHVHGESVQRLFHEKTRPPRSVPQQFREKLAQHTPTSTTPDTKLAQPTPVSSISGTKLAQHTPTNTTPGTKLARYSRKHPIWALFRVQGEYIHACGSNRPSRAILFTVADRTVRAGEFLLRAQPPLRLSTRPPASVPQHGGTPHRQGRSTSSHRPLRP